MFALGEVEVVPQDDGCPSLRSQLGDRVGEVFVGLGRGVRPVRDLADLGDGAGRSPDAASVVVVAAVHHGSPQVRAGLLQAVPLLVRPDERVVGDLGGSVAVAGEQVPESEHGEVLGAVQLVELTVAGRPRVDVDDLCRWYEVLVGHDPPGARRPAWMVVPRVIRSRSRVSSLVMGTVDGVATSPTTHEPPDRLPLGPDQRRCTRSERRSGQCHSAVPRLLCSGRRAHQRPKPTARMRRRVAFRPGRGRCGGW